MRILRSSFILVLLATSGASAQTAAVRGLPPPANAITVTGRATVGAEPDRARVSVTIAANVGIAGAAGVPVDDAANALRDALRQNGVTDPREVLPIGFINARNVVPTVVGTIAKPTRERLEELARNVIKAVPDRYAPAFANSQIAIALVVDDCGPAEARAERAAFEDAKARARRLASAAGVRLGGVIALSEQPSYTTIGCGPRLDGLEPNQVLGNPFNNQYGPAVVPITVDETVEFAIASH